MTDKWDELKESVEFYNAPGFIPRKDIRYVIAELVAEGDRLKEKAEKWDNTVKFLKQFAKDRITYYEMIDKLEAIKKIALKACWFDYDCGNCPTNNDPRSEPCPYKEIIRITENHGIHGIESTQQSDDAISESTSNLEKCPKCGGQREYTLWNTERGSALGWHCLECDTYFPTTPSTEGKQ